MNDPFDVLKKDHEAVEALFKEYEELEPDSPDRKSIVERITKELLFHAKMEESLCYPRFQEALKPEDQPLVEEAFLEHQEAKDIMDQLALMEEPNEDFEEAIMALTEHVRHHVLEEEQIIFPKVLEVIPPEVLSALGDDLITFKESKGGAMP